MPQIADFRLVTAWRSLLGGIGFGQEEKKGWKMMRPKTKGLSWPSSIAFSSDLVVTLEGLEVLNPLQGLGVSHPLQIQGGISNIIGYNANVLNLI